MMRSWMYGTESGIRNRTLKRFLKESDIILLKLIMLQLLQMPRRLVLMPLLLPVPLKVLLIRL